MSSTTAPVTPVTTVTTEQSKLALDCFRNHCFQEITLACSRFQSDLISALQKQTDAETSANMERKEIFRHEFVYRALSELSASASAWASQPGSSSCVSSASARWPSCSTARLTEAAQSSNAARSSGVMTAETEVACAYALQHRLGVPGSSRAQGQAAMPPAAVIATRRPRRSFWEIRSDRGPGES